MLQLVGVVVHSGNFCRLCCILGSVVESLSVLLHWPSPRTWAMVVGVMCMEFLA